MYKTILVPVDFSDQSKTLVKKATQFALENKATLIIAHVSEVAYIDGGYETYLYTGYDTVAHNSDMAKINELKELAHSLGLEDVVTEIATSTSIVGTILYEFCENYPVDLIVIGSSKNKKIQHFLLGDIAANIVRHSKCDVFVNKL